mgnify:CR=1 FL=1
MKTRLFIFLLSLSLASTAHAAASTNTILPWFNTNGTQGVQGLDWNNASNRFKGYAVNITTGFFGQAYASDAITSGTQLTTVAFVTGYVGTATVASAAITALGVTNDNQNTAIANLTTTSGTHTANIATKAATNEANPLVFQNALNQFRAVAGVVSNDVVIKSQLDAVQVTTFYGTTNTHPYFSTNGGLYAFESTLPTTQWTNIFAASSNGTFACGDHAKTNLVTELLAGDRTYNVWTETDSALTEGYYYTVFGYMTLQTQFVAVVTGSFIYPSTLRSSDPSSAHYATNIPIPGGGGYEDCRRVFVRTAGTVNSELRIFGGDGTDTRMVSGVTASEQTDALTLRGKTPDDFFNALNQTNRTEILGWLINAPTNTGLGFLLNPFQPQPCTGFSFVVHNGDKTNIINVYRSSLLDRSSEDLVLTNLMCGVGITTNVGAVALTNNQVIEARITGMTGVVVVTGKTGIVWQFR